MLAEMRRTTFTGETALIREKLCCAGICRRRIFYWVSELTRVRMRFPSPKKGNGAKIHRESDGPKPGQMDIDLGAIQVLRGICLHLFSAGNFRGDVIWILHSLLSIADGVDAEIRFLDGGVLRAYWRMMAFLRYMASREYIRPMLFRIKMAKLLELGKRSVEWRQNLQAIWASVDGTLGIIDGVNCGNDQFSRLLPWGALQSLTSRKQGKQIIAECELETIAGTAASCTGPASDSLFILNGAGNTDALCWMEKGWGRTAKGLVAHIHIWCFCMT